MTDDEFNALAAGMVGEDTALLRRALDWLEPQVRDRVTASGEPVLGHAAGTARVLAAMQTDAPTRAAALLIAAPAGDSPGQADAVSAAFGPEVGRLVQGTRALLRLGTIAGGASQAAVASAAQKEMLRKMLLAMAADLRIVLIRLASRLQTLRWHAASKVPCDPAFARETLDLYAPLANRLGIWQVKWEMEDLAFRFTDPARYKEIASLLEEKRVERETFITQTIDTLTLALAKMGIAAEVSGRPKHIYSIWNKMRNKHVDFSQLFDLRALRVIVEDERACFAALGLVHELWIPIPEEFDDYISRPKPNGYRSLHTVVADASARPFEVQIRTRAMHEFAEHGMAAHWRYKESGARGGQVSASGQYDRQLSWMRQLLAWNNEATRAAPIEDDAASGGGASAKQDVRSAKAKGTGDEEDRIYVLSPQARVIELPAGSTAVDFAYYLHSDLGHRCRGARIDGQMVPLQTPLQTGQTVEVIAAKSGGPSRDWLNPQLGFLASARARAKVRAWFNAIELQQRMTQGQALVEKELQRLGKTAVNLEHLAQQLGFARADDLYVAAAKEEFSLRQIDAVFQPQQPEQELRPQEFVSHAPRPDSVTQSGKSGVLVVGVGALMTQLARCCRPAPPDDIGGFVTRGRGVSIHRADCPSYAALVTRQPERVIDVAWGGTTGATVYPVDLIVHAQDRSGLLRDISEVFSRLRLNVIGVNTQSKASLAHMGFTVEIHDGAELSRAISALSDVAGVISAVRR
ncbi:MAG: bifunctional (p)ppGpp synthetase/guanosine-3',5'-bis(diphosphate) 3'-pyrophosphohydrolase [Burkholderiales bacterium]